MIAKFSIYDKTFSPEAGLTTTPSLVNLKKSAARVKNLGG
jgi:hypothetical protein